MACATLHGMDTFHDHTDHNLRAWQDSAVLERNIRQLHLSDKNTAKDVFFDLFKANFEECNCENNQECPVCIGRAELQLDLLADSITEETEQE